MRWIFISLVLANLALAGWCWFDEGWAKVDGLSPAEPVSLEGERLLLLSEVGGDTSVVTVFTPEGRLPMPDEVPLGGREVGDEQVVGNKPPLCTMVGPYIELLKAEYAVENLRALDIVAAVERFEVSGGEGYRVHQQPLASRKEALRRLHELQAAGIDSYVIPKGELENGISFGFYAGRSGAETRLAEIKALGYEVFLQEVMRTHEEIWVVLTAQEAAKVDGDLWVNIMKRAKGSEMRQNFCPGVAHGDNFH